MKLLLKSTQNLVVPKGVALPVPWSYVESNSPLRWRNEHGRHHPYLRWSWHPGLGEIHVGDVIHHLDHLPAEGRFTEWVRGFYFTAENHVVVRTFHPNALEDARIVTPICNTLRTSLLFTCGAVGHLKVEADNNWLLQNYWKYGKHW